MPFLVRGFPASILMVSWSDLEEIVPVEARRGLIMFLLMPERSIKDILIILDKCLYNMILKTSVDKNATKLFWYTDGV